jgi:hypothetical protein
MNTVDVTLPVLPETAERMADPAIRAKVVAMINHLLGPSGAEVAAELKGIFEEAHEIARATGLTQQMINAEIKAYRAEQDAKREP